MQRMTKTMSRLVMPLMLLFLMATLSSCIIRTRSHHRNGARSSHQHCHQKKAKRDHRHNKRDHRKKKTKRVCHRHPHGPGHH